MLRTSCNLFKRTVTSSISSTNSLRPLFLTSSFCSSTTTTTHGDGTGAGAGAGVGSGGGGGGEWVSRNGENEMSYAEAKRVMRLVNVENLRKKLGMENREVIGYGELLEACTTMGVAKSADEAAAFAKILDEAGIVLLFRDKVYLHPDKVVDMIRKAVPITLLTEDDPTKDELKNLQAEMEEIDKLAHKQVRRILWMGLGLSVTQVGLFFRLTFWEFSWDVMEPIAFFTTTTGIVVGYAYFLMTSRDPSYQDFMKRLFLSRQRKLIKRHNFDIQRFVELQKKWKSSLHPVASTAKRNGIEVEPEEILGH